MHFWYEASFNLKIYDGKDFMCLLIVFIRPFSEAIYLTRLMHFWYEASLDLKIYDGKDFMCLLICFYKTFFRSYLLNMFNAFMD